MTTPDPVNSATATDPAITLQDFHIPLDEAYTVELSDTVEKAQSKMNEHNVDQLPVVNANFYGPMVITRRAIAAVVPSARSATFVQDALQEHSNDPQQRIKATTSLGKAKRLLIEFDWVLTTDKDDQPMGLATVGDALRELLDHQQRCCSP